MVNCLIFWLGYVIPPACYNYYAILFATHISFSLNGNIKFTVIFKVHILMHKHFLNIQSY